MMLHVEEIGGAEMAVAVGRAAVETGRLDHDFDRGAVGIRFIRADRSFEIREAAADGRKHHVLDRELDGRMGGIDLPDAFCHYILLTRRTGCTRVVSFRGYGRFSPVSSTIRSTFLCSSGTRSVTIPQTRPRSMLR